MPTICVSLTPILRCVGLTKLETAILLIPPALAVIFAITLVAIKRGRKPLLLAFEGITYLLVAALDFASHFAPQLTSSATVFKAIDITVGVTAIIPLFLYLIFLYAFIVSDVLPDLPKRFMRVSKYVLLLFIPTILVADGLASFLGISYRMIPATATSSSLVALGFASDADTLEWTFFSSLSLALLTAYQALCFCLCFYRLIKAFVSQRRIEDAGAADAEAILFRGIGWMVLGTKLGAIESVIGFADQGFATAIFRRILRLLSRACLIIAIVKGLDTRENFQMLDARRRRSEKGHNRASFLKRRIGAPDPATFQHVGTDEALGVSEGNRRASVFSLIQHRMSAYSQMLLSPGFPPPRSPLPSEKTPTDYAFLQEPVMPQRHHTLRKPSQASLAPSNFSATSRVTIIQPKGKAPTLNVRFSDLDLPSPGTIEAELAESPTRRRPVTMAADARASMPWVHPYANPELLVDPRSGMSPPPFTNFVRVNERVPVPQPRLFRTNTVAGERPSMLNARPTTGISLQSFASASTADLKDFTPHFPMPAVPPRVMWRTRDEPVDPLEETLSRSTSASTQRSRARTMDSTILGSVGPFADPQDGMDSGVEFGGDQEVIAPRKSAAYGGTLPSSGTMRTTEFSMTPPASPPMSNMPPIPPIPRGATARPTRVSVGQSMYSEEDTDSIRARLRDTRGTSMAESVQMPWRSEIARVKTIGNAPMRNTPPPTIDTFMYTRRSVPIDQLDFISPINAEVQGLPMSVTSSPEDEFGPAAV